jgi:translation initiation factor 2B subunit (eIF-2B alpha/beta/delta family)
MTSLLHLAADVLPRAKAAKSAEEFRAAVQDASKEFIQRIDREALLIAYHLLAVVQGGNVVLTISRSSTLLDSFRWIHTQGRVFRVLCAESLPGGEGVRLVDELRKYEIDAELFRDDDLDWQLRRADVVLVGADTVSESGVINKKGTSRLALSARSFRIPLYVVTGSTKFFPVGLPLPTYSEELFDVTPLEDISGVICEVGCLGPARIRERLPRSEMLQELLHQA